MPLLVETSLGDALIVCVWVCEPVPMPLDVIVALLVESWEDVADVVAPPLGEPLIDGEIELLGVKLRLDV